MATYALTFATRAAFDTSLASGDIYNLMQGVTSSKPSVAITATITESGETFACGTNVMVDIKSVGPGDYVMYDSTNNKFFGIASKWIDNNYPAQPTQHIMIFKAGVLPARYAVCGTVIKRFGNRIRLAGTPYSIPWSYPSTSMDYAWNVPGIMSEKNIIKKSRTTTTAYNSSLLAAFPSTRYHEMYYAEGNASTMPILRSEWDAAIAAGEETVTARGKTVTMADFDYSFDKFLLINWAPLWPASSGAYAESKGIINTRKIVNDAVANHGKTLSSADYAAGYCYNYSINPPGLGRCSWFLGVISEVCDLRVISHSLLVPIAWRSGKFWSSSMYSSTAAWVIQEAGYTDYFSKHNNFTVVPLADLILEN